MAKFRHLHNYYIDKLTEWRMLCIGSFFFKFLVESDTWSGKYYTLQDDKNLIFNKYSINHSHLTTTTFTSEFSVFISQRYMCTCVYNAMFSCKPFHHNSWVTSCQLGPFLPNMLLIIPAFPVEKQNTSSCFTNLTRIAATQLQEST